ncbi:MAG: DUF58 domain-containing protein [Pseudomonadota bacterium]
MKKVTFIPFLPFLGPPSLDTSGKDPYFFRERASFNRYNLLKATLISGVLLGFFFRDAWVVVLTELAVLLFFYFKTKQLAECIEVKRSAPLKAVEQDRITFKVTISNHGNFALSDCIVRDSFSGCTQSLYTEFIESSIPSKAEQVITFKSFCNGGMGRHFFGPLQVFLRDPFGIFNFVVSFDSTNPIDIFPRVFEISPIPIKKGSFSLNYGNQICDFKGLSANFQGVREYRKGDSLRHISWRLSAKRNQLLVKEFDQMVNTNVVVALDVDLSHHAGQKSDSTWEYAKDLTNSVICQQIREGNSVQLLTNFSVSELRRGESHMNDLLMTVSRIKEKNDSDYRPLEERYFGLFPNDATLIHIGPIYLKHHQSFIEALNRLRSQGTEVLLYLIDPLSFLARHPELPDEHFQRALHSLEEEFAYLENLAFRGFDFKVLKRSKNVSAALLESTPS